MNSLSYRRALPWLGLALILILYGVSILRLHSSNFFGLTQDDTIYFSSAQAMASGHGYILPSIPGKPAATKYPVLYPWVLSLVWRWNPSFPSNLADAVGVTAIFGACFLTLVFMFLRGLKGISDSEALFLTAFCALHPLVILYGGSVLSDMPFAALAFASMLIADDAMRPDASSRRAVACAVLVGLAMLTRVLGIPARQTSLRSCCAVRLSYTRCMYILPRLGSWFGRRLRRIREIVWAVDLTEPPASGTFRLLSPKCVIRRLRFDVPECASFTLLADWPAPGSEPRLTALSRCRKI